ncbi:hypothetical protein V2J09_005302 [Rumex salicifolius]
MVTQTLTPDEQSKLHPIIQRFHTCQPTPNTCTSLLVQRINAPASAIWRFVRAFDNPQTYKHFIKSCKMVSGDGRVGVGCVRDLSVISGLPASTSRERLEILDDENRVMSFRVLGGEHRLQNYRSVTTVNEFETGERVGGGMYSIVLESYVVDIPDGNTTEDTKMFADTVVKLNLQKLYRVRSVEGWLRSNGMDQSSIQWAFSAVNLMGLLGPQITGVVVFFLEQIP